MGDRFVASGNNCTPSGDGSAALTEVRCCNTSYMATEVTICEWMSFTKQHNYFLNYQRNYQPPN